MKHQKDELQNGFSTWIAWLLSVPSYLKNAPPKKQKNDAQENCKSAQLIAFLHSVRMDATPENYQMAWEYHYGPSAKFRQAIDDATEDRGYLTDTIARQVTADHLNHWNAIKIAKLITGGNQLLHNGSQVIRQSRDDSRAYGEALESELDSIKPMLRENAGHYTALVSITKTMAVKSFEAQRQLEEASESLAAMREKLAGATEQAETDQLTGLPNRWAFEKRLEGALLRAREAMKPLSVAFIDVDHFKDVNDQHGHETGDLVLKRIAEALDELSGNNCHVARHGGEEFVILFLNMSADEAWVIVDQAREGLCEHNFTNLANGAKIGRISFSAGISCLSDDGNSRAMLRRADTALYEAKNSGRNRVVIKITDGIDRDPRDQ